MPKIYKSGKVAVVLAGRYAGKKVVVIKQSDDGTKARAYPHAYVVGIERYPRKITRNMGAKKVAKRSRIKPFIKAINYNHLMPTRYALELDSLKPLLNADTFKEPSQRIEVKKEARKVLEARFAEGKNKWYFSQLKF